MFFLFQVLGANTSFTTCGCNHLSTFGSGFVVMPNPIDFSYVFANAGFAENLTIYLTLIISFSIYLVTLIYARYQVNSITIHSSSKNFI